MPSVGFEAGCGVTNNGPAILNIPDPSMGSDSMGGGFGMTCAGWIVVPNQGYCLYFLTDPCVNIAYPLNI